MRNETPEYLITAVKLIDDWLRENNVESSKVRLHIEGVDYKTAELLERAKKNFERDTIENFFYPVLNEHEWKKRWKIHGIEIKIS